MESVTDFPDCFWDRLQLERALGLLGCASATEHLNSRRLVDKTVSDSQQVKVRKMMDRKIFMHIILRTSHSGDCGSKLLRCRQRRALLRIQPAALGHGKYITVMEGLL